MKKSLSLIILSLILSGCTTPRTPQYLSSQFNDQIQRNVVVISLIDARPDKSVVFPEINRIINNKYVINLLKDRGYCAQLQDIDTHNCGSLSDFNSLSDLSCLQSDIFKNGNLFILFSIDQYDSPSFVKITGVLYSVSTNSLLWKDQVSGDFVNQGATPMAGMFSQFSYSLVNSISPGLIYKNNLIMGLSKLLEGLPKPRHRKKKCGDTQLNSRFGFNFKRETFSRGQ